MSQLTTNTTTMQTILEKLQGKTACEDVTVETNAYTELLSDLGTAIETLPDAGSGGSGGGTNLEACTVTFYVGVPVSEPLVFFYMNTSGELKTISITTKDRTVEDVVKNSIVCCGSSAVSSWNTTGDCEWPAGLNATNSFIIRGDCSISYG